MKIVFVYLDTDNLQFFHRAAKAKGHDVYGVKTCYDAAVIGADADLIVFELEVLGGLHMLHTAYSPICQVWTDCPDVQRMAIVTAWPKSVVDEVTTRVEKEIGKVIEYYDSTYTDAFERIINGTPST